MPKIEVRDRIDAPAEAAWSKLAEFGGLETWAPGVSECSVEGKGVGAVRRISMGGMTIAERLEHLDEAGRTLRYSIVEGPMPTENYLAEISVEAAGADACAIRWSASFDAPALSDEQAEGIAKGVEGSYQGMVDGLKKALA